MYILLFQISSFLCVRYLSTLSFDSIVLLYSLLHIMELLTCEFVITATFLLYTKLVHCPLCISFLVDSN